MPERGQILVLTGGLASGTLATVHDALPVSAVIRQDRWTGASGDHDAPRSDVWILRRTPDTSLPSHGTRTTCSDAAVTPAGQPGQGTAPGSPAASAPDWTAAGAARHNGTQGSWHRAGSDTHAITRSLCCPSGDTPQLKPEDHETLRHAASAQFSSRLLDVRPVLHRSPVYITLTIRPDDHRPIACL